MHQFGHVTGLQLGHCLQGMLSMRSLQALRRNPFAPEVPCHRIVKSDLGIGGFSGSQVYTKACNVLSARFKFEENITSTMCSTAFQECLTIEVYCMPNAQLQPWRT